jgi:hypothetical protein
MYGGARCGLALVRGDDVARAVAAGSSHRRVDPTMLPTRTYVVGPVVPPGAAAPVPRVGPAPPRVGRRAREAGGSPRVALVRRQGRRVGPLGRVDERDRRAFARRWMTTSSAYLVSAARAPCNDLHDITSRITTRTRVGVTDHVTDHYPNASGSRPSNVRDVGALGLLDREHADEPPRQVPVEQKLHAGVASRRSRSAANSSPAQTCRSVSSGKSPTISSTVIPDAMASKTS